MSYPRLKYFFKTLRTEASSYFDKALDVELRINEEAGEGARQFAWCEKHDDGKVEIAVASKLESQDDDRIEGILRHEIGHALDFLYGRKELEKRLRGALPVGAERRADAIAECVWGDWICYDAQDIQTIGPGKRPRPSYLPR